MTDDRERKIDALKNALSSLEKIYGKGTVIKLGEDVKALAIEGISTGSLALDIALGGKGIPRGRITEVFGPESSGKTTLCLNVVKNAQKQGGIAAYIDAEHAIDPSYAAKIGVNINDLLFSQPSSGEEALNIAETLVRSGAVDVIVIDSVAALVPKAELEGEIGDQQIAIQARLMSQALRKLATELTRSKTAVLFINQLRERPGVMFGPSETTPGGRALKFYASIRIDLRRIGTIKDADTDIGVTIRATVVKNKVAVPYKKATFDLLFASGISYEGDLLNLAEEHEIITKSGAWINFGQTRLGQGKEKARTFLQENKKIALELENAIRKKLGLELLPVPATEKQKVSAKG